MRMKPSLAAAFATAFAVTTLTALAQSYNIRDLGAVAGQTQSAGFGLNASGQAAGDSSSPSGAIATLFSGGKAINLGTLFSGDVSPKPKLIGCFLMRGPGDLRPFHKRSKAPCRFSMENPNHSLGSSARPRCASRT